jgi:NAD+ synthase
MMPCYSSEDDITFGNELVSQCNIDHKTIELNSTFDTLVNELNINNKLAKSNTKARLRMTTLYALAQENGYLVLGTDNAAE